MTPRGELEEREVERRVGLHGDPRHCYYRRRSRIWRIPDTSSSPPPPPQPPKKRRNGRVGRQCSSRGDRIAACGVCRTVLRRPGSRRHAAESDEHAGGNIDGRNAFGLSALHLATWRNHLPIVRRLLDAGADPDARDGESGWSSLHRALHFGHLCIAGVLLQFGASLALEDTKGRTPVWPKPYRKPDHLCS
uniref:Uncharacterized protein n=1 Tax=Zea mays TaxID=4577 RepID=A0A804MBA3_MAIZE